jgi:hypothetical protein
LAEKAKAELPKGEAAAMPEPVVIEQGGGHTGPAVSPDKPASKRKGGQKPANGRAVARAKAGKTESRALVPVMSKEQPSRRPRQPRSPDPVKPSPLVAKSSLRLERVS